MRNLGWIYIFKYIILILCFELQLQIAYFSFPTNMFKDMHLGTVILINTSLQLHCGTNFKFSFFLFLVYIFQIFDFPLSCIHPFVYFYLISILAFHHPSKLKNRRQKDVDMGMLVLWNKILKAEPKGGHWARLTRLRLQWWAVRGSSSRSCYLGNSQHKRFHRMKVTESTSVPTPGNIA